MATADIGPERAQALAQAENARFVAQRPRSMALQEQARRSMPRGVPMAWMDDLYDHPPIWVSHGEGAHFTDVDGHTYLDMYVADMSAFCGHAPAPVAEAVARRMKLGNQFLLPGEDAIVVAEHLAGRYGLPKWQFTLVGHAGQHRGHPPRPRADRPPDRAALRRQVPRRGRRDARGRPGRGGRGRAPGPAAVDHDPGPRRRLQRRRGGAGRARAGRRGPRAGRAGDDERRLPAPASPASTTRCAG